ncbi:MAG: cobalamin-dependent protein, partial [Clostridiales bacterium]|nr:cobalamin-dependent protein [Clostridiales bacterium]
MQIVLCALNAKFIHSSYAVHSLAASVRDYRENITVKEYTINHSEEFILSELFRLQPKAVAFSCYLWNIGMVLNIAANLKKILPRVKIILGGPEVSYDYETLIEDRAVDFIIVGEGEKTFRQLAEFLMFGKHELFDLLGVAVKQNHT